MLLRFQSLEVEQTRKMKEIRGFFFLFVFLFLFFLYHVFIVKYKKQHGALAMAETKV